MGGTVGTPAQHWEALEAPSLHPRGRGRRSHCFLLPPPCATASATTAAQPGLGCLQVVLATGGGEEMRREMEVDVTAKAAALLPHAPGP